MDRKRLNRGQIWGLDLVVAVFIFSVSLSLFYFYILNDRDASHEIIDSLQYRGKALTDSLLGEGFPKYWDSASVIEIGLLSDGKVNETKLERFYTLSTTDYVRTKELLNAEYDYYFFFDWNMTINGSSIEGIGKPGVTKSNINAVNLIKIGRVSVYQNKPVGATLYIWQE